MKVFDCFKREIHVGDFVAKASLSWKSAHMRVGKVTNISEKGFVSIDTGKSESNWSPKQIISVDKHNLLLIDSSSLPESFTTLFK